MIITNRDGLSVAQMAFITHPWSGEGNLRIKYMVDNGMSLSDAYEVEQNHWDAMKKMCDMINNGEIPAIKIP
jgi:hypothetical protein